MVPRTIESANACPRHCISVCIQALAKYEWATNIKDRNVGLLNQPYFGWPQMLLLFDSNGDFAKIAGI
jgi:N-methylhydantoinase B/oxoprolinase/acetone carboxylase alpha subunit